MIDVLLLRFDAPLMSFGRVLVDEHGFIDTFPGQSMLAGLFANALGFDHGQFADLQTLQERVRYAARCDRPGEGVIDFHTVDLGQVHMEPGWTTSGRVAQRKGGTASEGTHIRRRHYWADAVFTLAATLERSDEAPTVSSLAEALHRPARPLFIGRKTCLPSTPILLGTTSAACLRDALAAIPRAARSDKGPLLARWPERDAGGDHLVAVTDERDWANQVHVGRRFMYEGRIELTDA